jgi:hypothetical protein
MMTKPRERDRRRARRKNHAADDAMSIVIQPALTDFAKGDRRLWHKPVEGYFPSRSQIIQPQIAVTHSIKLV